MNSCDVISTSTKSLKSKISMENKKIDQENIGI